MRGKYKTDEKYFKDCFLILSLLLIVNVGLELLLEDCEYNEFFQQENKGKNEREPNENENVH